jgi:hypothetical protein
MESQKDVGEATVLAYVMILLTFARKVHVKPQKPWESRQSVFRIIFKPSTVSDPLNRKSGN